MKIRVLENVKDFSCSFYVIPHSKRTKCGKTARELLDFPSFIHIGGC